MTDEAKDTETGEEPEPKKPARRRAAKPKPAPAVEATEAAGDEPVETASADDAGDEAPATKPKRRRATKPATDAAGDEKPSPPAKPAAAKSEAPSGPPPVVRAQAKYVRSSARKARLVCDHIRGKEVAEARAILAHAPRAVANDWQKLLESAVANAEHNHELLGEDLRIKDVFADEGPTLKRYRPRAMGRATRIRKRTSHLTITLTPKG